jgi:hypothetical protein
MSEEVVGRIWKGEMEPLRQTTRGGVSLGSTTTCQIKKRGSYETVNDERVHRARCPDCGGIGVRTDEFVVESDCVHYTACRHEFDARLEMMKT